MPAAEGSAASQVRARGFPVIARGDIRWYRFDRPDKRRPVLLLGRQEALASWSQVPVIPFTTQARGLPWEVPFGPAVEWQCRAS
jgi:mRNA-degrading endonuclease toxin of MazEF toxin-antitoxin module